MCVQQTVIDLLLENDVEVHVVADATSSRSQQDRLVAFQVRFCAISRKFDLDLGTVRGSKHYSSIHLY